LAQAPPPAVRFPYDFVEEGVRVHVPNIEVTRDDRNVLVHCSMTNPSGQSLSVDWQHFFTVINSKGDSVRPASDCEEDWGNGFVLTMGSFSIKPGKTVQLLIYFPIEPSEVPIQMQFADGAITREHYSSR
jgi:hypothetical protein